MEFKKYIGSNIVEAEKMSRLHYNTYRGWELPQDEKGDDSGYKIKDLGSGHISWLPEEEFNKRYKSQTKYMTFGLAIESLKMGYKVARKGWNGKGIFIELQLPDKHSKMTSPYIFIDTTGLQSDNKDAPRSLVPWLASQTDMLAEDWEIVDGI